MKKTSIENLVVFRDRKVYGYTVRYRSGRHSTKATGDYLVLPKTLYRFMKQASSSISHDEHILDYHEVIYYA